jgi:hypothetical protein
MVDLDEILYGGDGIEYYLGYILLNPVASTFPKWLTFKILRWVKLLNRLVDLDEILHGCDDTEDDLYSILSNVVASTIPKCWRFEILKWVHLLKRLVDLDVIFYRGHDIKMTSLLYFLIPYIQLFQNYWSLNF